MSVKKFSISVSPLTYRAAEEVVKAGEYRSLSHVFEEGAKTLLKKRLAELLEKSENPCEALA